MIFLACFKQSNLAYLVPIFVGTCECKFAFTGEH